MRRARHVEPRRSLSRRTAAAVLRTFSPAAILLFVLLCSSCGSHGRRDGSVATDSTRGGGPGAAGSGIVVRDDLGRELRFPRVPQRIVSLAPSITESLYAIGAGRLLVGATSWCTDPPEAAALPRVGDMLAPDIERILALQPDLVVLTIEGNRRETFDALVRLDMPCLVTQPRTLDGVLSSLRLLGSVTGRDTAAAALADSLAAVREAWSAKTIDRGTAPAVLMVLSLEPLMVVGADTFLDELIVLAGGRNAGRAGAQAYPALSREEVLVRNPDIMLLPDDLRVPDGLLTVRNPEWRRIAAIRRAAVHRVDADLFLRPGPRLFSGLPLLAELISQRHAR